MDNGSSALVVGGGSGIGRAISRALARAGAAVIVADKDVEAAEAVVKLIEADAGVAQAMVLDVLSQAQLDGLFDLIDDWRGGVGTVVMVVGGSNRFAPFKPLHQLTDGDVDLLLDINLHYVVRLCRNAIRYLLARGKGGTLIGIGSVSGLVSSPHHAPYGLSKAALAHLARTISVEYGADGIRMNLVAPGVVATESTADMFDAEASATLGIPVGRRACPDDIAEAVAFLASPHAAYIAGQTVVVDGGASAKFFLPTPGTRDPG